MLIVKYIFFGNQHHYQGIPVRKRLRYCFFWHLLVLFSFGYLASKQAGGLGIFITLGMLAAWVVIPLFSLLNTGVDSDIAAKAPQRLGFTRYY